MTRLGQTRVHVCVHVHVLRREALVRKLHLPLSQCLNAGWQTAWMCVYCVPVSVTAAGLLLLLLRPLTGLSFN